jgi:glycerol-3-phosphate dehydrogenase
VLITRGLSEMTRIGVAYGASPLTFLGLGGVGDLFLTCGSSTSRNYTVGYRMGKGESLETVLKTLGSVAEGVTTAKGVKMITDELEVKATIATAVSRRGRYSISAPMKESTCFSTTGVQSLTRRS